MLIVDKANGKVIVLDSGQTLELSLEEAEELFGSEEEGGERGQSG